MASLPTKEERVWKTRVSGVEYGPYTETEMFAFIDQGRVLAQSEVWHAKMTQGLWLKASTVQLLRAKLIPPVPPVQSSREQPIALNASPGQSAQIAAFMRERAAEPPPRRKKRALSSRAVVIASIWLCWLVIFQICAVKNFYSYQLRMGDTFVPFVGPFVGLREWTYRSVLNAVLFPGIPCAAFFGIATFMAYFLLPGAVPPHQQE